MTRPILLAALAAGSSSLAAALRSRPSDKVGTLESYTFSRFVAEFQRTYEEGSEEWATREALFNERLAEASRFNAAGASKWKMGISKFMDHTEAEKKMVLGYKGSRSRSGQAHPAAATSLERQPVDLPQVYSVFGAFKDANRKTKLLHIVRDQGSCGSCWAEAATSTFEGQLEVNEAVMQEIEELRKNSTTKVPETPTLASQGVVSCTENPRHCGGRGGCSGATVELAYDMVQHRGGLPFAVEWNYMASSPPCRDEIFSNHKINIGSFTVLPSNKQKPLLEALVSTGGPIAISVDASNWFMYSEGIFQDGKGDFTVNHAVTLMGYKMPDSSGDGWYSVKNSWGAYWGERGYIRIEMKADEDKHCGMDHSTHDGVACDGDPDTALVCGTCGILYDSVYPTGLKLVPKSQP